LIVKLREPLRGAYYKPQSCQHPILAIPQGCLIEARQMPEAFMYETASGWLTGPAGCWLCHLHNDVRVVINDAAFREMFDLMPGDSRGAQ